MLKQYLIGNILFTSKQDASGAEQIACHIARKFIARLHGEVTTRKLFIHICQKKKKKLTSYHDRGPSNLRQS